jgi:hypothetical protein
VTSWDETIRHLRRAVAAHPAAVRAAVGALASEGRAYAQTPEGKELSQRLLRSEYVSRLRSAWEIVSFGVSDEDPRAASFPSAALEAFARAVFQPSFESRMHRAIRSPSPSGRERREDREGAK